MATLSPAFGAKVSGTLGVAAAFVGSTAQYSRGVDTTGYTTAACYFLFGNVTGVATSTLTISVEESSDNTTFTAISGATTGAIDTSSATLLDDGTVCIVVNLVNGSRARYLRVAATPANSPNVGQACGFIALTEGGTSPTVSTTATGATYRRVVVV